MEPFVTMDESQAEIPGANVMKHFLAISTASTQKYWHFLGNKYYYFCVPKF
jgi:hypothetical protein